ncbi:Putative addiction module component [Cyclobacterium xiamenense]|uniref:Putative addiction module component n=2 Tax=Cyclobacterium xiamenense TaxID=1297121 RepID=A0A1H6XWP0_9BACT|nr:Putative addiction module component [Cyclobacterium xiamenense]
MDVIKEKYVYVQGTFLKNVTTSYRTAHNYKHMKSSMTKTSHSGMIINHARFHLTAEKKYKQMKITLEIQDERFKTFMDFIQTLDYVSIKTDESSPTQWQEEEVNRRLELIESGEMKTRDWELAKKEIFKK